MIDHVALDVTDIDRSRRFYEQALEPLGYTVALEMDGCVGFAHEDSLQFAVRSGKERPRRRMSHSMRAIGRWSMRSTPP